MHVWNTPRYRVDHLFQDEESSYRRGERPLRLWIWKSGFLRSRLDERFGAAPHGRFAFYTDYAGLDEGAEDPSSPLNQVTYNVGRKFSVRIVATNKPPMIAKAMGPQNTVGAIGIMPRTVDTAVSMIGRKRELLASMAASQAVFP